MLQLDSTSLVVDGVTVFRDHADPNQFWYLPAPVRLAERPDTGTPAFTLVTYRAAAAGAGAGPAGGGFLMFETDLRLDDDTRASITGQLTRFAPGRPVLSPVPFDSGEVQCVALDLQGAAGTVSTPGSTPGAFTAVEEILGASVPSLFGDNRAIFGLGLTAAGSTVLKQAFAQGGAPVGVIYKLTFTGLRPALHVRIEADLSRVYQELAVGVGAQVYWVKAGIEAAFQKLREDGVIHIEVDDFVPDGQRDQQETWALDFFRDKILAEWFTPSLSPTQVPTAAGPTTGAATSVHPANPLSRPVTPVGSPVTTNPLGGPVKPAVPPKPAVANPLGGPVNPIGGPAPAIVVNPLGTPVAAPVAALAVPLGAAHPAAHPVAAPPPRTGPPSLGGGGVDTAIVTFKLRFVRQDEQKHFSMTLDRADAVQRVHAPQGFIGVLAADLNGPPHVIDVDLDDPFFREFTIDLLCGAVDFAAVGLTGISVALSYGRDTDPGGPKHHDLTFDAAGHADTTFSVFTNAALDQTYRYRIEYTFAATGPWRGAEFAYAFSGETADRTLDLDPSRYLGFLDVSVEPTDLDAGAIQFTEVHLEHAEGNAATLTLTPAGPAQSWKVRTADRTATRYRYAFAHVLVDGSVVATEPVETSNSRIAVVDPFPARLDIRVVPAWDPATVRTVLVDLRYADDTNDYHREEHVEFAGADLAIRTLYLALRDPDRREFAHRHTVIGIDGQVRQSEFVDTADTLVTVQ